MSALSAENVSRLMHSFRQGDQHAAKELVEMFHPELRRLAVAYMKRERSGHTWQPTALVNELYLKLIRIKALPSANARQEEKAAFFELAAQIMKRLLIEHARPLYRQSQKVTLEENLDRNTPGADTLAEIEQALERLGAINPRLRNVVELRVFEGLTAEEIAARIGCGTATVTRDWHFAKHWLQKELRT
jgi:RNA polymerase sigma factor (TIGR02999 family)